MKLIVLSAVCLWRVLCLCASVNAMSGINDILKDAALKIDGPLPCDKWDCDCAYKRQRGCCCVANEVFALEEYGFMRMMGLSDRLTALQRNVEAITDNVEIAFTAGLAARMECFGPFTTNVPIPYTNITLNHGQGYNPALGIFAAPRAGLFVFSFTAYSNVGEPEKRLYHKVQLMKNGKVVTSMWEDNREDMQDSGTQVVLLDLQRGDQVYMELVSGRNLCGITGAFNTFSGHLLYPYND